MYWILIVSKCFLIRNMQSSFNNGVQKAFPNPCKTDCKTIVNQKMGQDKRHAHCWKELLWIIFNLIIYKNRRLFIVVTELHKVGLLATQLLNKCELIFFGIYTEPTCTLKKMIAICHLILFGTMLLARMKVIGASCTRITVYTLLFVWIFGGILTTHFMLTSNGDGISNSYVWKNKTKQNNIKNNTSLNQCN